MALKFNSLVLIPSDHCNISCKHCAPECGPSSRRPWDVLLFKQCIADASKITSLTKSIHFAGGEPFLYFQQLLELARHAQEYGFSISAVTNGFWGTNQCRAAEQISYLVDAGLYRMELSTDSFHQEFISIETIKGAIKVLKRAGVRTILRVVTTRKHMIDETMRQLNLDLEDLDGLEIVGSPLVPVGRARVAVQKEEYYLSPSGRVGACSTILNLTVRADGNVFPCCAGSEINSGLSLGNINNMPLDLIAILNEWNMLIKKLVYQGPASFFSLLQENGLAHKIKLEYTNICHVCTELFGDPEVVSAIKQRIFIIQAESLAERFYEVLEPNIIK